jgi:hypothetical protein
MSQNLCMMCKEDMGECNPRQFCGKTYCRNEDYILAQRAEDIERLTEKRKAIGKIMATCPLSVEGDIIREALQVALTDCEAQIITLEELY